MSTRAALRRGAWTRRSGCYEKPSSLDGTATHLSGVGQRREVEGWAVQHELGGVCGVRRGCICPVSERGGDLLSREVVAGDEREQVGEGRSDAGHTNPESRVVG